MKGQTSCELCLEVDYQVYINQLHIFSTYKGIPRWQNQQVLIWVNNYSCSPFALGLLFLTALGYRAQRLGSSENRDLYYKRHITAITLFSHVTHMIQHDCLSPSTSWAVDLTTQTSSLCFLLSHHQSSSTRSLHLLLCMNKANREQHSVSLFSALMDLLSSI